MKKISFFCIIIIFLLVFVKVIDKNNTFSVKTIQLYDKYDDNNISIYDVFDENKIIDKFIAIYQMINYESSFEYIEVMDQSLEFLGKYQWIEDVVDGDEESINQEIGNDIITPLCSLQLSDEVQKQCGISNLISDGRVWDKDDFLWNEITDINVIMGDDYKEYYKVGDKFEAIYLGKKVTIKIIGFLKNNSTIDYLGYDEGIDNVILMPALNITSEYIQNSEFEKKLYLQKIECYAKCYTNKQFTELKSIINTINKEYDFKYGYCLMNGNYNVPSLDIIKHYSIVLIYLVIFIGLLVSTYKIITRVNKSKKI